PVEAALASVEPVSRSRVIRTWIGTSRGENGRTKVTFVWEAVPKAVGDRSSRDEPARVALMAVGTDGSPYFRGRVPDVALASSASTTGTNGAAAAARAPSSVTFDVKPGKMQLRVSVEGTGAQTLDSEVRDITVPDLAAPQTMIGTPKLYRARTPRELQQLKGD